MEKETLISIIVPVYNAEKYLKACLDSVLSQTYPNIEVILVNDGSTDASGEICRQYAARNSRIRLIHQENAGVASARNRGMTEASGEFIVFVDADDLLMPWVCEAVQKYAGYQDVILFGVCPFSSEETVPEVPMAESFTDLSHTEKPAWIRALLGTVNPFPGRLIHLSSPWAKAYRRSFLVRHKIHFPDGIPMGEDLLFNLQVYLKEPSVCSTSAMAYCYRQLASSTVHRYNARFSENDSAFHAELNAILEQEKLREAFQEEVGYQQINGLLLILSNDIFHRDNPKSGKEKRSDFLELVSREDYRRQFPMQIHRFEAWKKCVLFFAVKKQYYILKLLFTIRMLVKRVRFFSGTAG